MAKGFACWWALILVAGLSLAMMLAQHRHALLQQEMALRYLYEQRQCWAEGLLRVGIELLRAQHTELVLSDTALRFHCLSIPGCDRYHGVLTLLKEEQTFILQTLLCEHDKTVCSYTCTLIDHGQTLEVVDWYRT